MVRKGQQKGMSVRTDPRNEFQDSYMSGCRDTLIAIMVLNTITESKGRSFLPFFFADYFYRLVSLRNCDGRTPVT